MILGYPHFRTPPYINIYIYTHTIHIHILVLLVREINLLQCLERSWTWLWHGTVPLEPGTKLLELIGSWVHAYQRMCSIHKYLKLRTQCTHANMSKPLTILLRRRCILGFVLEDTFHWMSHLLWCALANKAFVVILELFNDSVVLFIFFPTIWHVLMILMWPVGGPCRIHPICRVPSSAKSTLSMAVVVSLILFQRIKTNWPRLLHWVDTWLDTRRGICFCILFKCLVMTIFVRRFLPSAHSVEYCRCSAAWSECTDFVNEE